MTVQELILRLLEFDNGTIVVIDDADTGWYLHVLEVTLDKEKNIVIIGGDYNNELE